MTDFTAAHFVKVCGVTTLSDAIMAIDAGADAIGLILATSPRQLSTERALAIATATRGRVARVLVFRDHDDAAILNAVDAIGPDVVQLHGALSDDLGRRLRERDVGVVKALAIASDEFYSFDDSHVDAVMVDGVTPGSGQSHSWTALSERHFSVPVIAAGGLNGDNVADVIVDWPVWGVDSASGVESAPGIKDRAKVEHFVGEANAAFHTRVNS